MHFSRIQKNKLHFYTKAARNLTEEELDAISDLFSENYGKYSLANKNESLRGKQISLKPSYYKRYMVSNDYTYVALAYYDDVLVGQAFYVVENFKQGNATWVIQLVVKKEFRKNQIAKKLLFSIWGFSNDYAWGLATTNPLTIKTLESATLRKVSLTKMKQNIKVIKQLSSKVNFISQEEIFITENNSVVNSSYYVSHDDIPNYISKYGDEWVFGNLEEGFEWLAFTFRGQEIKKLSKQDFDNFIEYSESRLIDAYSRMEMITQPWTKHTAEEIEFIKQYISDKSARIMDMGCGTARHIAELYKQGYKNINGYDFSENLITQAKKNYPEIQDNLSISDCRNLKCKSKADVILCLYDVIGSFPKEKDNINIIKAARRNLKKNGIFICSVMNMHLTENICKYKFDVYSDPKRLFKLRASQIMQKSGNIFNPENFVIDTKTGLVFRKEIFKDDGFLDSEYIIRDKRYRLNEIKSLLKENGFIVLDSRFVRAGRFDNPLKATDLDAKEILIVARKK